LGRGIQKITSKTKKDDKIPIRVARQIICKTIGKLMAVRTQCYEITPHKTFEVLRLPRKAYWALLGRS